MNSNMIDKERKLNRIRFAGMTAVFIQLFAIFYCRDIPQALQTRLMEQLHLTDTEYNLLYSFYALPVVFTAIIFGALIDLFGKRALNMVTASCLLIGQLIQTISILLTLYPPMLAGRLFQGLSVNQQIIQSLIVVLFFHGNNASFFMGITVAAAKMGNMANSWLTPAFFNLGGDSLLLPNIIGLGFTILSFVAALVSIYCQRLFEEMTSDQSKPQGSETTFLSKIMDVFRALLTFDRIVWILLATSSVIYGIFYCFNNFASNFLEDVFGFTYEDSNTIIGGTYLFIVIATPLMGYLVDRFGHRPIFLTASAGFAMLFASLSLKFMKSQQSYLSFIPLTFLMTFFCLLMGNVWTAAPLAVANQNRGLCVGTFVTLQNVILFLFPIIAGEIKRRNIYEGYGGVMIFLWILSLLSLFFSIYLSFLLRFKKHNLLLTSEQLKHLANKDTLLPSN